VMDSPALTATSLIVAIILPPKSLLGISAIYF
jgi:hypothetical protein